MERIKYYDISVNQELSSLSGEEVGVTDLARRKKLENPTLFESKGLVEDITAFDFDEFGIKRSSRWERAVATMIYAISDQVPNREEVKRGRQIIEQLPKSVKKGVDRKFVLSFLPYLLTGFNFHLGDIFVTDSNSMSDGIAFIGETYNKPSIRAWSVLCAHRESRKVKALSLRDHIHEVNTLRAVNLKMGLLGNARGDARTIEWYQQTPSPKASSNMFPEIFINYLETGRIIDLIEILKLHHDEMERLMAKRESVNTHLSLKPLDNFTSAVERFLNERYGEGWGRLESISNKEDKITTIARQMTMPAVARLMPFYGCSADRIKELENYRLLNLESAQGEDKQELINEVFNWFIEHQRMTVFGKALYETAFYFVWGFLSATEETVSVGLEREHENYQYHAFKQGYIEGLSTEMEMLAVPLIYARRIDQEKPKGLLRDISFRQFWRDIN